MSQPSPDLQGGGDLRRPVSVILRDARVEKKSIAKVLQKDRAVLMRCLRLLAHAGQD